MTTAAPESAASISSFLTDLYGLNVTATKNESLELATIGAVASYADGDGNAQGHIVFDLPAAAILGAALTQIPNGAVEDAVKAGKLPDNLRENVGEVLNIAVNLFVSHSELRLVLNEVLFDADAAAAAVDLPQVSSVDLKVQRYGDGGMFLSHKG